MSAEAKKEIPNLLAAATTTKPLKEKVISHRAKQKRKEALQLTRIEDHLHLVGVGGARLMDVDGLIRISVKPFELLLNVLHLVVVGVGS